MAKKKVEKSKGWCFTINNPTDEDFNKMMSMEWKYLIYGYEKGEEEETEHIQGFMWFLHERHFTAIKKAFGNQPHIEAQKAHASVAAYYCTKDNDFYEFGEFPQQGKRMDLMLVKKKLDNGFTLQNIAEQHFPQWCQYRRSFEEYTTLCCKDYEVEEIDDLDWYLAHQPRHLMKQIWVDKFSLYGNQYCGQKYAFFIASSQYASMARYGMKIMIDGKMTKFEKIFLYTS